MGFRIGFITLTFGLLYGALAFNIYNLQVTKGDYYSARAEALSPENILPPRGDIYFTDKNGAAIPAAVNRDYPTIYANTSKVGNIGETAEILSGITGINKERLVEIVSKPNDPYEPILKRATKEQVDSLKEAKLSGIGTVNEGYRFYPFGSSASHALGFVSINAADTRGIYGAEAYYEERLSGYERGTADKDIQLTLDREIQSQAEVIIENLIKKYNAEGGTVIVQNPKTGAILAMASFPDFDPNNYSDFKIERFLNPAVQAVYEPGSSFKIFTVAAGIDSGKITPNTTFYDSGSITLNGRTIKNWDEKAHGQVTATNILEKSLNTGTAMIEQKIGHDIFYDYLVKFDFKERTNIDLPAEVAGSLRTLENNSRDVNFATASFGQGVSVTPISLIKATSAIANGGVLMQPYINEEIEPKEIRRVISRESAKTVAEMMVSAVDKAEIAKISGYSVAGKTGTAQVPDFNRGGYTDSVINSYVGFAPAYDPQFVILIKLDKPAGAPLAGLTVVPAFRELASFILNYYNIPPDRVQE